MKNVMYTRNYSGLVVVVIYFGFKLKTILGNGITTCATIIDPSGHTSAMPRDSGPRLNNPRPTPKTRLCGTRSAYVTAASIRVIRGGVTGAGAVDE